MPTMNSKEIIKALLKNNGCYSDDTQAFIISQYENQAGKEAYHVAYTQQEFNSALQSPFVFNLKVMWKVRVGLSEIGETFLENNI